MTVRHEMCNTWYTCVPRRSQRVKHRPQTIRKFCSTPTPTPWKLWLDRDSGAHARANLVAVRRWRSGLDLEIGVVNGAR